MNATKTSKKKYIDSHWLVFVVKGALASVVGLGLILTFRKVEYVTQVAGVYMLALGLIELCNVLYRKRKQHDWGIPLTVAIVQIVVASLLLSSAIPEFVAGVCGREYNAVAGQVLAMRVVVLACYTIFASISSILIAFSCFKNSRTDKFIWLMEGMFGTVMGLVMLAENGVSANTHLHVFGVYSLVKGLTDMIYGVHARSLKIEAAEAKAAKAAEKASEKAETVKASKKTTKKNGKKAGK